MAGDTLAQASVMRFRSSCNVGGGVAYTRCLMYPHRRSPMGFNQDSLDDLLQLISGIYLNAGPTCLARLGRNQVPAHLASSRQLFSQHSLKRTLFQISVWNPDWVPNLGFIGVALDFPLEVLHQFLSFESSMNIVMQEDDTITQHARAFASDGFSMAQCLFPFSEIEGTLIWNNVLFNQ
ncbi:hypothetical protein AVEN_97393-1 [Araneus ventricosus]|uniref:Uncharacterized protein n=1 Tax=Araneus ventricosus TaxID=182803 RepID=A0A4Y2MWX2_ARAVE|nr:hypothetical protein AVEN_97393-1 [Araneus ventricosus]